MSKLTCRGRGKGMLSARCTGPRVPLPPVCVFPIARAHSSPCHRACPRLFVVLRLFLAMPACSCAKRPMRTLAGARSWSSRMHPQHAFVPVRKVLMKPPARLLLLARLPARPPARLPLVSQVAPGQGTRTGARRYCSVSADGHDATGPSRALVTSAAYWSDRGGLHAL